MTWRNSIFMGLGILALLALVYFIQQPYRDITTAPPEHAWESPSPDADLSYISIPIRLQLSALEEFLNNEIEETLVNKKEHKRFKIRILGIPTTIEGDVKTVVKRTDAVQVRTRDDWLELSIPLWFRARMDGESFLDPDAKTRGRVTVTARFRFGIDEQWQPTLVADADYRWDKRPYLRLGPIRVRVSGLLGDALEKKLDDVIEKLHAKVDNDLKLRQKAQRRWHELHQVRPLSDSAEAWLVVDPVQAFFQPIAYEEDALLMEFGLSANLQTVVGKVPAPPQPEPLPDLVLEPSPESGFSLQLPVHLNYAGITDRLNDKYAHKPIELEHGTLTPKEFRLYTSNSSVVLAARISATSPGRLLNTHGWIYLLGQPRYDSEKHFLYVENLEFSRTVDNPLVSGATWILQDRLRENINRTLQFDLHDRIEELHKSANERINRPLGEGFVLSGSVDELNLTYLIPQRKELLLVLKARGQLAIRSALTEVRLSGDAETETATPPESSPTNDASP